MFKKVAFTMYPITDVARARRFYEETLGLKRGSMGNQGEQYWIEYDLPAGGCLALTNFIPDKPSDAAGGTIALEVEDLDQLIGGPEVEGRDVQGRYHSQPGVPHGRVPGFGRQLDPAAPAQAEGEVMRRGFAAIVALLAAAAIGAPAPIEESALKSALEKGAVKVVQPRAASRAAQGSRRPVRAGVRELESDRRPGAELLRARECDPAGGAALDLCSRALPVLGIDLDQRRRLRVLDQRRLALASSAAHRRIRSRCSAARRPAGNCSASIREAE